MYKYDGFSTTEFTFDTINKTINSDFVAFKGQKYYLLFCSSDFDEIVNINEKVFNYSNNNRDKVEPIINYLAKKFGIKKAIVIKKI